MNVKQHKDTVLSLRIENAALKRAWKSQACFEVPGFCAMFGFKDTRYLRSILARMVARGELYTFLASGKNGRMRRFYCAKRTMEMNLFTDPTINPNLQEGTATK